MSFLTLRSDTFSEDIQFDGTNLSTEITWKTAVVNGGKWALYDAPLGIDASKFIILETNGQHEIPPDFSVASARGLDYEPGGLLLFADHNYVGTKKLYTTASNDITDTFPPKSGKGVSSVITWEGVTWKLSVGKNHEDPSINIGASERRNFFGAVDDVFSSVIPSS